jgi:hypothetical protein
LASPGKKTQRWVVVPSAQASVAVNSLGLLDLVQIAAAGLAPKMQYQVYLADSNHPPFGKLQPRAVLRTNPDGAGIVQTIGPLKVLAESRDQSRLFDHVPQTVPDCLRLGCQGGAGVTPNEPF